MHRSSQSVAALATALAKAQAELVNPEKSLVATIRVEGQGEAERSFRYAPLSSGLDIIRKTLSRHEIAAIQTTAIDAASGTVNLTTVLAHASGEWIASDWPVCHVADTATPHRMGAALTYARRYGLFTLVGIAGDDDIDAPDLNASRKSAEKTTARQKPTLELNRSAELRRQLLDEITGINSAEDAAQWARRILPMKNSLTLADARFVEQAFCSRIAAFKNSSETSQEPALLVPSNQPNAEPMNDESAVILDSDSLPLQKPRRIRDKEHLKFVSRQACLVCGREPSEPHHLRFAQPPMLGRKVSDEFTVPLCRGHHRELHRSANEMQWWHRQNIDALKIARTLWRRSHADGTITPPNGKNDKTNPKSSRLTKGLWKEPSQLEGAPSVVDPNLKADPQ